MSEEKALAAAAGMQPEPEKIEAEIVMQITVARLKEEKQYRFFVQKPEQDTFMSKTYTKFADLKDGIRKYLR